MNRHQIKAAQKQLKTDNQKHPDRLKELPKEEWPPLELMADKPIKVFRSKAFAMQVFKEGEHILLSVNRTEIDYSGNWKQDISWDELQELKNQSGYGNQLAVEIYPKDRNIVNVANMRHLWIVKNLDIGWKS